MIAEESEFVLSVSTDFGNFCSSDKSIVAFAVAASKVLILAWITACIWVQVAWSISAEKATPKDISLDIFSIVAKIFVLEFNNSDSDVVSVEKVIFSSDKQIAFSKQQITAQKVDRSVVYSADQKYIVSIELLYLQFLEIDSRDADLKTKSRKLVAVIEAALFFICSKTISLYR